MTERAPKPEQPSEGTGAAYEHADYEPDFVASDGKITDFDKFKQAREGYLLREVAANQATIQEINAKIDAGLTHEPMALEPAGKKSTASEPSKELVPYDATKDPTVSQPSKELVPVTDPETDPIPVEGDKGEDSPEVPAGLEDAPDSVKRKYKWHEYARMAMGLPSLAIWSAMNLKNKFAKSPDEAESRYNRRLNVSTIATVAIAGVWGVAKAWTVYHGVGSMGSSGAEDHITEHVTNGPNRSNNPWDVDGNGIVDAHEYSIQSHHMEDQFLNGSGRHGNDFNKIELHHNKDGVDMNDLYGQFGEQFRNSPHETAAQFEQFHRLGVDLPDNLKELDFKPGETSEQYTERVAELLHGNRDLKDRAADFALDQLHGKSLEDLTRDYESNYIVPDGKGGWLIQTDPEVTSADPNDKILVMGQANGYIEGVRIPCGQPIRIPLEQVQQVQDVSYGGQGGAGYQETAYSTTTTTTSTGGQGNGGTTGGGNGGGGGHEGGNGGGGNGGHEGGNDDSKNWNLVPDPEDGGVTPIGLDESVTPRTDMPSAGDNGTSASDGSTDTVPGAAAPNATDPTAEVPSTDTSGNQTEQGANGSSGASGGFDTNNV